jgi:hypothetical protein
MQMRLARVQPGLDNKPVRGGPQTLRQQIKPSSHHDDRRYQKQDRRRLLPQRAPELWLVRFGIGVDRMVCRRY